MFSATMQRPSVRKSRPSTTRLGFERLEERDCPSGNPVLSYSVSYGAERQVTFAGSVSGTETGFANVVFTGAATAGTMTNSSGSFSVTVTAQSVGTVHGTAYDFATMLSSAVVDAVLASNAPVVSNFTAVHGIGNVWTFSGRVSDESPAGLTVTFGGLPSLLGRAVTVEADGTFELTVMLQPGESGIATAQTMDWWGLMSNTAQTAVFL